MTIKRGTNERANDSCIEFRCSASLDVYGVVSDSGFSGTCLCTKY